MTNRTFFWPEPNTEFESAVVEPEVTIENIYFVCHGGKILMSFDNAGRWQPATAASLEPFEICLLYTSPSPRDAHESRMPSSA